MIAPEEKKKRNRSKKKRKFVHETIQKSRILSKKEKITKDARGVEGKTTKVGNKKKRGGNKKKELPALNANKHDFIPTRHHLPGQEKKDRLGGRKRKKG